MRAILMSGAGNRLAVIDGFADELPGDPAALARSICRVDGPSGIEPRPDGLLLVGPARADGSCAMVLYNADGSRPETCGNGLRCAAKLVRDRGHVARDRFSIETDSGPRIVEVDRGRRGVERVRAGMGPVRVLERDLGLRLSRSAVTLECMALSVGNPHVVVVVGDERQAPVSIWGPEIERHERFPEGTNAGFLAERSGGLFLRVWERGVGETLACGSGACAAAVAARERGLAGPRARIALPGGILEVETDDVDDVWLTGPVEELRVVEIGPEVLRARAR